MLQKLPKNQDPNLLVGFNTSDDAAIYRLSESLAMVMTADIITPPVDDPVVFGQIAAANSLSDVYAMGGRPVACLNLVGFPADKLEPEVLEGIITGALSKITEAGAVLAGGHTIEDDEPKFGLSVNGLVHPEKYWANAGARPGDGLILTKPIGSGVLFNANLKGGVSEQALAACIETLTTLNKVAAETLAAFEVHAATDVTGFGLAGHGLEMAKGSDVTLRIAVADLPIMQEALKAYEDGVTTGVNASVWQLVGEHLAFERDFSHAEKEILVDPQTSGGLLAAVPGDQVEAAIAALHEAGVAAATQVGVVEARSADRPFLVAY